VLVLSTHHLATLPMHRWCFSIGNVAKRAWDQGCAEPQAAPMPRVFEPPCRWHFWQDQLPNLNMIARLLHLT
jgi:hypothetical protein